jgi:hypothetical protein
MKDLLLRIAVWASAGLFVSLGWGLYFATANKGVPIGSGVYLLARFTQPAAAIALYLRPGLALGLASVAAANAAVYALIGWIIELTRQHRRPVHVSS